MLIEQNGRLVDAWYAAALSIQVQKSPVKAKIFDIPMVLWRSNGQIVVFQDRCSHRNAPLSEGRVVDGNIQCPYHSWAFSSDGTCVSIPSEGPTFTVPTGCRMTPYPSVEKDGLVWIWPGDSPAVGLPSTMPYWSDKSWTCYYMETTFNNSVTNLVENFMDIPHTVSVHKGWFRSEKKIPVKAIIEVNETGVFVEYDQPKDSIGFTDRLLNPLNRPVSHSDKFFMPNRTQVDYMFGVDGGGMVITSTCTPITENVTKVYTLISYQIRWWGWLLKYVFPWYTGKVINQDVEILDLQGNTIRSFGMQHNLSSPADYMHVQIERLRNIAREQKNIPIVPVRKEVTFWI